MLRSSATYRRKLKNFYQQTSDTCNPCNPCGSCFSCCPRSPECSPKCSPKVNYIICPPRCPSPPSPQHKRHHCPPKCPPYYATIFPPVYNPCKPKKCHKKHKCHCKKRHYDDSSSDEEEYSPKKCNPCKPCPEIKHKFSITNLVSNVQGRATYTDPTTINSWGILIDAASLVVANNATNNIQQYSLSGVTQGSPITVTGTTPTGIVLNPISNGYYVTGTTPSRYITATEAGTIDAWASGASSTIKYTAPATTIYRGLAITPNNLYVADFYNNKIDTFDVNFVLQAPVNFPFVDPAPIVGYAPNNIAYINGQLFVAYAKQDVPGAGVDDVAGPGNGYINIFTLAGVFVRRFVTQGYLNSPWAMISGSGWCGFPLNSVLVGNSGDGTISVYSWAGDFLGKLRDCKCVDLVIDELGGLVNNTFYPTTIYFASGPNNETNGLVGVINKC